MENDDKVTRRAFLEKVKKLAYLTPVILTVVATGPAGTNEVMARSSGDSHTGRGRDRGKGHDTHKGQGYGHHHGGGVSPAGNTSSNSRNPGYGRY